MKILLAGRNDLLEAVLICLVKLFKNDDIAIVDSLNKLKNKKKIKAIIKKKKYYKFY